MGMIRREFLLGIGALGALGIAYSRFVESGWIEVREQPIALPRSRLSAPLTVLHLSDFHRSSSVPLAHIAKAIALGLECRPDLICITGDLITAGERHDLRQYGSVLQALPAAAPAVAVLGNHDGGAWSLGRGGFRDSDEVAGMLREAGFIVLVNESLVLDIAGNRVGLVGTGDLWAGWCDPQRAFRGLADQEVQATFVLAHNPDTKDALGQYPWDLMLCGHTHGGQVVIPLLGAPIVPVRDRRYVAGLNRWVGRWVYTTRGVGSLYGIRFNCRPEVSILSVT
jgi:predicted MPP superfamily phosphohydrolase